MHPDRCIKLSKGAVLRCGRCHCQFVGTHRGSLRLCPALHERAVRTVARTDGRGMDPSILVRFRPKTQVYLTSLFVLACQRRLQPANVDRTRGVRPNRPKGRHRLQKAPSVSSRPHHASDRCTRRSVQTNRRKVAVVPPRQHFPLANPANAQQISREPPRSSEKLRCFTILLEIPPVVTNPLPKPREAPIPQNDCRSSIVADV